MTIEPYRRAPGTVDAGADFSRNVFALKRDVDAAKKKLAAAGTDLSGLAAQIAALDSRVTITEGAITTLQSDFATLYTDVSDLGTAVIAIDARVTALEGAPVPFLLDGEWIAGADVLFTVTTDIQAIPHSLGRAYNGILIAGVRDVDTAIAPVTPASAVVLGGDPTANAYVTVVQVGTGLAGIGATKIDVWVF